MKNVIRALQSFALSVAMTLSMLAASLAQEAVVPGVTVIAVTERDVTQYREFVGRVEAVEAVGIRARVSGFLNEVSFEEGTFVSAGDLLYRIEPDQYQARLAAVRAELASARADLQDAERDLERNRRLVESNTVSEVRLDDARARAEMARATVLAAEASVQTAELDVSYTEIVSPIDGKIGETNYTLGNFVELTSGVLAEIVQLDPIRIVFSLSEVEFINLQQEFGAMRGADLQGVFRPTLRLPNGTMYTSEGEISFFGNTVDSSTGTVPVRARFDNEEGLLLPGQFVTVVLQVGEVRFQPSVPLSSVQRDRNGAYVFVVNDSDVALERRVSLGRNLGDGGFEVLQGIEVGELVVTAGVQKLRDGMTVAADLVETREPPTQLQADGSGGEQ